MSAVNKRLRPNPPPPAEVMSGSGESGLLNERVIVIVFGFMKWDIHALCSIASVNRKLRVVAKRVLWRELCFHRAPQLTTALSSGSGARGRMGGGWHALAKLLFFCSGCHPTRHCKASGQISAGHFVKATRFSKTSGRSFLTKQCRGDLLFVSDPCEHSMGGKEDDLGIYRGVFREFMRSRTRACLIRRSVALEEKVTCPYCGSRVWSMAAARLVPRSAARRLGSHEGGLEYFVCVNGHLHGSCWLVPLSSDDEDNGDVFDDEGDDESDGGDWDDRTVTDGSTSTTVSSIEEEVVSDELAN